MPKVPARYIGDHSVLLKEGQGKLYDGNGLPLRTLALEYGDTLMIPDTELYGFTQKYDPRGIDDPRDLGVGRCVLPEHAHLSPDELFAAGYIFHEGRPDFEPFVPLSAVAEVQTPPTLPPTPPERDDPSLVPATRPRRTKS